MIDYSLNVIQKNRNNLTKRAANKIREKFEFCWTHARCRLSLLPVLTKMITLPNSWSAIFWKIFPAKWSLKRYSIEKASRTTPRRNYATTTTTPSPHNNMLVFVDRLVDAENTMWHDTATRVDGTSQSDQRRSTTTYAFEDEKDPKKGDGRPICVSKYVK